MNRHMVITGRFILTALFAIFTLTGALELQAKSTQTAKSLPANGLGSGVQLIMFEQEGCHFCEVWDANIGVIYGTTPEGIYAPLKKVDIHVDDDVANVKPVIFTPTFVLYKDRKEVGRLTGYISDDFFWGMLAPMLKKHGYDNKVRESKASAGKERIK